MRTSKVFLNTALMLAFAGAARAPAQTTQPVLRDVLRRFDSALSGTAPRAIRGTIVVENGGTFANIATTRAELKYIYFRDGDRFDVAMQTFKPGDAAGTPSDQSRSVVGPARGIFYSSEGNRPPLEVLVRPDVKRAREVARARLQGAEAMDGYVAQDFESLSEILRHSEASIDRQGQTIDGHDCYVVHSQGPHGQYTVFFDPSIGYLPRKILVRKTRGDLFNDKKLWDVAFSTRDGMRIVLASDEYQMDHVLAEEKSGHWILTGMTTHEAQVYSNGKILNVTKVHHRDEIDFDPDFAKVNAFRPAIPDGTRVLFDDPLETGLAYEWRNGNVIPKVDLGEVGGIQRSIFEYKNTGSAGGTADASGGVRSAPATSVAGSPWPWLILLLVGSGSAALAISLFGSRHAATKGSGGKGAL